MPVSSLQGFDAPFTVVRAAKRESLIIPPIDVFTDTNPIVVTSDQRFPVYEAVYWLAAPKGRGRYAIEADGQGRVFPNLLVHRFHVGTPGVSVSKLNPDQLDLTGAHIILMTRGLVRVDHLKDETGTPLGLPSAAVQRKGDTFAEYKAGLLNPTRLRQLQAELQASEEGRTLLSAWAPQLPKGVEDGLLEAGNKPPTKIKLDREMAASMRQKVDAIAEQIRQALEPAAPAPAPVKPATTEKPKAEKPKKQASEPEPEAK